MSRPPLQTLLKTADLRVLAACLFLGLLVSEPCVIDFSCPQNTVFVNSYAIISSIGKGSFGEVKLAMNTHDMEVYALKLISKTRRQRRLRDPEGSPHVAEASVMSEINLMKELCHPNLVRLVEVIGKTHLACLQLFDLWPYNPVTAFKFMKQ